MVIIPASTVCLLHSHPEFFYAAEAEGIVFEVIPAGIKKNRVPDCLPQVIQHQPPFLIPDYIKQPVLKSFLIGRWHNRAVLGKGAKPIFLEFLAGQFFHFSFAIFVLHP